MKWHRIREILILLCRCLFVALLFLSLARPQLESKFLKRNKLGSYYIIIDNSWSMGYGENFTRAKESALRIIDESSPGSEFFIVPLCPAPDFGIPFWTGRKDAVEFVRKIELSYHSGRIVDIFIKYPPVRSKFPIEYIYIGDGQEVVFKDVEIEGLKTLSWLKIPGGSNICIKGASMKDPVAISVNTYDLIVNIANFSTKFWRGKVNLVSGDFYLSEPCEIDPNSEINLLFNLPTTIRKGRIFIDEDSLIYDNQYFFSKSIPQEIKVLIVGEGRYLNWALNPTKKSGIPFETENIRELGRADLRRFDIIIIHGISEINEIEVIKLENFISTKKGLIIFLDNFVGENLKDFIKRQIDATIGERIELQGYATIDYLDFDYLPFKIFKENPGFKNIKFFKFFKIKTDRGIRANLSGDYPLIISKDNLILVTSSLRKENTDIMFNPNFIPLLYRLVYSLKNKNPENEYFVGDSIITTKVLKGPKGEYVIDKKFTHPGCYTLDGETLGVNLTPKEGNLKPLDQIRAGSMNIKIMEMDEAFGRTDLTPWLLLFAVLMIVLEMIFLIL